MTPGEHPTTAPNPIGRILLARGLRDFGDGLAAVVLPAYLVALGFGAAEVGLVATFALLGSALMTLGIGFAAAAGFAAIAAVAFVGTVNPSAGSVSVFAPLEQAFLTGATPDAQRTGVFARYSLVGALAAAAGALAAAGPDALAAAGVPAVTALESAFLLYALLGVAVALAYRPIPSLLVPGGGARHAPLGPSRRIVVRLSSASIPSPAASRCSRSSRSGYSSGSACRSPRPACSFSGPVCCPPSPSPSRPGWQDASAW